MVVASAATVVTYIGFFCILHSAYSCLHYRSLEMISEGTTTTTTTTTSTEGNSAPPMDVVLEVFLGFILCLSGQILSMGPLVEIYSSSSKQIIAPLYKSRDFDIYNTRRQSSK